MGIFALLIFFLTTNCGRGNISTLEPNNDEIEEIKLKLVDLQKQISLQNNENLKLKNKVNSTPIIKKVEKDIENLNSQIEKINSKTHLNPKIEKFETNLQTLKNQLDQVGLKPQTDNNITNIEDKINKLKNKLKILEDQTIDPEVEEIQNQIEVLKEKIGNNETTDSEIKKLEKKLEKRITKINNKAQDLDNLQSSISDITIDLAALKNNIPNNGNNESINNSIESLSETIDELKKEFKKIQKIKARTNKPMSENQEEIPQNDVEKLKHEFDRLRNLVNRRLGLGAEIDPDDETIDIDLRKNAIENKIKNNDGDLEKIIISLENLKKPKTTESLDNEIAKSKNESNLIIQNNYSRKSIPTTDTVFLEINVPKHKQGNLKPLFDKVLEVTTILKGGGPNSSNVEKFNNTLIEIPDLFALLKQSLISLKERNGIAIKAKEKLLDKTKNKEQYLSKLKEKYSKEIKPKYIQINILKNLSETFGDVEKLKQALYKTKMLHFITEKPKVEKQSDIKNLKDIIKNSLIKNRQKDCDKFISKYGNIDTDITIASKYYDKERKKNKELLEKFEKKEKNINEIFDLANKINSYASKIKQKKRQNLEMKKYEFTKGSYEKELAELSIEMADNKRKLEKLSS